MKLFRFRKTPAEDYDREHYEPVVRSSICTGERVAGFREKGTGRFRDVMLLKTPQDLEEFKARFGIEGELKTIY